VSWRYEDGGPRRRQTVAGGLGISSDATLEVTTRLAPAATMVVGDAGRVFLLRHTAGDGAVSFVEQIDRLTLEPLRRSPDLAGGPAWPGGAGVAPDGFVHVVFGNHAHRLNPDLQVVADRALPRDRPYNSFVPLGDGHLVTKDFGGSRPGTHVAQGDREPTELVVLEPVTLEIVARLVLPEASIARLSADGNGIYVVGDTSLFRVAWDGHTLNLDESFRPRYRLLEGQTYGWDCVIAAGAAWFLDDGEGSERYTGTLRGLGVSTAPLHLVRVGLATGAVTLTEVCGLRGGLVANPPLVDESRGVAVGYDAGNGVMAAFEIDTLAERWRRHQDHAGHFLLYAGSGELVTGDHSEVVILDVSNGDEMARVDTGHGIQLVLFPAPGEDRDFYVCSFAGVSRVAVTG
jgi:hypothetical protein